MTIYLYEEVGFSQSEWETHSKEFKKAGHSLLKDQPEKKRDAEVVIIANCPFRKEQIDEFPNLKMISVAFTGTDHIDIEYCRKNNISVSNCAGYSTHSVAEEAIGMAISLMRKFGKMEHLNRQNLSRQGFLGTELFRKTVGIIGYGAIGAETARLFAAFGCRILIWNRSDKLLPAGFEQCDLKSLLIESDIVSLHIPLSAETKNMIGDLEFKRMKETSILINTARGGIVDQDALAKALNKGWIAGAGIDIFDTEPPLKENHPLLQSKNTLPLPHIGYATHEAIANRSFMVIENVLKWMEDKPVRTIL